MRGILPFLLLFSLAYAPLHTHGRRRIAICTPIGDSGILISSNVSVIDLERVYCCKLVDPKSSTYISYHSLGPSFIESNARFLDSLVVPPRRRFSDLHPRSMICPPNLTYQSPTPSRSSSTALSASQASNGSTHLGQTSGASRLANIPATCLDIYLLLLTYALLGSYYCQW